MSGTKKLDSFDRRRAGILDLAAWIVLLNGLTILLFAVTSNETVILIAGYLNASAYVFFVSKDIFLGHSVFKLSHGIQIVDSRTEQPVTELRTVIRNSTLILLFPIEFLVAVVSPQRRIGDLIAGTKLVSTDNKRNAIERIRTFQLAELTKPKIIAFLVAAGIAVLSFQLLKLLIKLV
ncbi:MAG: RDD family protein [Cyclobacteriaceae bacterium]